MGVYSPKILLNQAAALGAVGSPYGALQSQVLALNATFVLPAGTVVVIGVAGIATQVSSDGGTTWLTVFPAATGGIIPSDGFIWRVNATAAGTAQFFVVN